MEAITLIKKVGLFAILSTLVVALFSCSGGVPRGNATLEGKVVNATTGVAIFEASVCMLFHGAEAICDLTDAEGDYTLEHLPAGMQTFRIRAAGHTPYEQQIELVDGETTTGNFASNPELTGDDWRIVLSWGQDPRDLDSHIWVPLSGGGYNEVFYRAKGDCDASPWSCLDVDDTTSYGPETTTITQIASGTYPYAIHWYAGEGTWAGSDAVVRVYNATGLVREFHVPNDTTHTVKSWWYIFDFNNGNITVHNVIQNDPPLASSASLQTK